jgi:acetylornithine deacetylase/succinyl-diaminopimelate desuccinylase-like protein
MTIPWQDYLTRHQDAYIDQLLDFLRIPSISSLPENKKDVQQAAEWVANRLQTAGIHHVEVLPTGGHPVVYGDWLYAGDKPTIMIYGHFDTQPVDPLDLWDDPPFEPTLKDDRVYARGASDDKGNMLAPIIAAEAILKISGELPVNLKFFFEGQEEIGSPQLPEWVAAQKERLACDLVVSADGGQWEKDQPAILTSLRGICALQIDVKGAASDVHSGVYGGSILNPIQALIQVLVSMHGNDGRILVEGFYDKVRAISETEQTQIKAVPFNAAHYQRELGVDALFGEPGYSTYERAWVRPTLEFNGIWGGFQGKGVKTVIPSEAHAKISCRLVPDQQPEQIVGLIERHVKKYTPSGVTITVHEDPSRANPYQIPYDHPGNQAAYTVHQALYDKAPLYLRNGGTIPVCALFQQVLNVYTVNFAFGLNDENIHAPNEFWRLNSFTLAQKAHGMLLESLSKKLTTGDHSVKP